MNHFSGILDMSEDCLDEQTRAEDILLGSLGLGEDAHIIKIIDLEDSYRGIAVWSDGEEFEFESEEIEVRNTKCGVIVKGHGNSTLGTTTLM